MPFERFNRFRCSNCLKIRNKKKNTINRHYKVLYNQESYVLPTKNELTTEPDDIKEKKKEINVKNILKISKIV